MYCKIGNCFLHVDEKKEHTETQNKEKPENPPFPNNTFCNYFTPRA